MRYSILACLVLCLPALFSAVVPSVRAADVVLVTDVSKSMMHTDPRALARKTGQGVFLHEARLSERVRIGLVHFTDTIVDRKVRTLELVSGDPKKLGKLIEDFDPEDTEGRTDIAQGLDKALDLLLAAQRPAGSPDEMRAVVLLSDGDFDRALSFLEGTPPAWRTQRLKGDEKSLGEVIKTFQEHGVILYAIPVTPLVYGETAIKTTMDKWRAGHKLLDQLARATGGRSFVRSPSLSFARIYGEILSEKLTTKVDVPVRDGRFRLNPLYRTVMIAGPRLRGVRLASGDTLTFPEGEHPDISEPLEALGTTYFWKRFADGLEMAIFHRPGGQSSAEQRKAWDGLWIIQAEKGWSDAEVVVAAFGDIALSWDPALRRQRWPSERPTVYAYYDSRILKSEVGRQWAKPLLENLSCEAKLMTPSGQTVPETEVVGDRQDGRFRLDLKFPLAGQCELRVAVKVRSGEEEVEIFHALQPIYVMDKDPVALRGYRRTPDGQREPKPVFDTSKDSPVLPVEPNDGLDVDIVSEDPDRFLVTDPQIGRPDTPQWILERLRRLSDPKVPYVFEARPAAEAAQPNAAEVPVLVTVQDKTDGSEATLRLAMPKPYLAVGREAIYGQLRPRGRTGEPLYELEEVTLPFDIDLFGVTKSQLDRHPYFNVVLRDEDNRAIGEPARASIDWAASGESCLKCSAELVPSIHLGRYGVLSFRIKQHVFGFPVYQSIGFKVCPSPLELRLWQGNSPVAATHILRAHENTYAELIIREPEQLVGDGWIELREVEAGSVTPKYCSRVKFQDARGNRVLAEIPAFPETCRQVAPVVSLNLRHREATEPREVALHVPESEWYYVETAPVEVVGEFKLKDGPTVRAFQNVSAPGTIFIRGGDPKQRSRTRDLLVELLRLEGSRRLKVSVDTQPALDPDSVVCRVEAQGDPSTEQVRVDLSVDFRVVRPGTGSLTWVIGASDLPDTKWSVEPLKFPVLAPWLHLRMAQAELGGEDLVNTAREPLPQTLPLALAGFGLTMEFLPGDPQTPAPAGQKLRVFVDRRVVEEKDLSGDPGQSLAIRLPLLTPGEHVVECLMVDQSGVPVVEYPGCRVQARELDWEFVPKRHLADVVPENLSRFPAVYRVKCSDTEAARLLTAKLQHWMKITDEETGETYSSMAAKTSDIGAGEWLVDFATILMHEGGPISLVDGHRYTAAAQIRVKGAPEPIKESKQPLFDFSVVSSPIRLEVYRENGDRSRPERVRGASVRGPAIIHVRPVLTSSATVLRVSLGRAELRITARGAEGNVVEGELVDLATCDHVFDLGEGVFDFPAKGTLYRTDLVEPPAVNYYPIRLSTRVEVLPPPLTPLERLLNWLRRLFPYVAPMLVPVLPWVSRRVKRLAVYLQERADEKAEERYVREHPGLESIGARKMSEENVRVEIQDAQRMVSDILKARPAGQRDVSTAAASDSGSRARFPTMASCLLVAVLAGFGGTSMGWPTAVAWGVGLLIAIIVIGVILAGSLPKLDVLRRLKRQPPRSKIVKAVLQQSDGDRHAWLEWTASDNRFCWRKLGGNVKVQPGDYGQPVGEAEVYGLDNELLDELKTERPEEFSATEEWLAHEPGRFAGSVVFLLGEDGDSEHGSFVVEFKNLQNRGEGESTLQGA